MSDMMLLIVGLFLPLFPLSMVFTEVFERIRSAKLRLVLLLAWPQIGLYLIQTQGIEIPSWVVTWALATAALYGFRALALREVGLWTSFMAISVWALLWVSLASGVEMPEPMFYALGFSAPLALLVLICGELEKRFGAAYTGLYGGLALSLPRLSGVLVMVILAIVATPLFPGFAAMISMIVGASAESLSMALVIAAIWVLWSWAGVRLIQGLIVGPEHEERVADISSASVWMYTVVLVLLIAGGVMSIGRLS